MSALRTLPHIGAICKSLPPRPPSRPLAQTTTAELAALRLWEALCAACLLADGLIRESWQRHAPKGTRVTQDRTADRDNTRPILRVALPASWNFIGPVTAAHHPPPTNVENDPRLVRRYNVMRFPDLPDRPTKKGPTIAPRRAGIAYEPAADETNHLVPEDQGFLVGRQLVPESLDLAVATYQADPSNAYGMTQYLRNTGDFASVVKYSEYQARLDQAYDPLYEEDPRWFAQDRGYMGSTSLEDEEHRERKRRDYGDRLANWATEAREANSCLRRQRAKVEHRALLAEYLEFLDTRATFRQPRLAEVLAAQRDATLFQAATEQIALADGMATIKALEDLIAGLALPNELTDLRIQLAHLALALIEAKRTTGKQDRASALRYREIFARITSAA